MVQAGFEHTIKLRMALNFFLPPPLSARIIDIHESLSPINAQFGTRYQTTGFVHARYMPSTNSAHLQSTMCRSSTKKRAFPAMECPARASE